MPRLSSPPLPYQRCEVAIVGGGICGAALALLLRRRLGGARLLLLEERASFPPAGSEVAEGLAGLFFTRVLPIADRLAREHLPSHGSRFWFADADCCPLEEMSEIGTRAVPELPAFLVDRARLAESLLELAEESGVAIARPVRVEKFDPHWPWSRLTVQTAAGPRHLEARWVVDAGGAAAWLARTLGVHRPLDRPPLDLYEARWSRVADLDGSYDARGRPRWGALPVWPASRSLAANHFCGRGWCARLTPLPDGDHAVALACDPELYELARAVSPLQSYSRFVRTRAGLRELLRGARLDPGSFHQRAHRFWYPEACCGPGWFLVGDAAGSFDPLFCAPLEKGLATVLSAARIIGDDLRGALGAHELEARLAACAPSGRKDCARRLACRGQGNYELLGDARAMAAAYFLDTAFSSHELARIQRSDPTGLESTGASSSWARTLRACLRDRLVHLARRRHAPGLYGRHNRGWRDHACTGPLPPAFASFGAGLLSWLMLEKEDFRERFTPIHGDSRVSSTEEIARLAAGQRARAQALRSS